ncbi:MAG TPA: SDR family oxidoreductase [Pyrinomonadaceae bacterium]|jgi:short-subunit dehydrogenase|nr:SDR family oxidoreductase [Pyrinomonadaceae bacterium]
MTTGKDIVKLTALAAGAIVLKSALNHFFEYDLKNKTVLITGGSRGLGLVMAREFAHEGARLVLCARDEEELQRARSDIEDYGAEVMTVLCDITNKQSVDDMVAAVNSRFGGVDVLVNNAGVIQVGPIEVMTTEDFEIAMQAHFWGPLYTTMAVLPTMRQKKSGRIVNISSIGGKVSVPHLVPYSASKFALVGLSKGLRAELMKDGIKVTTVCPGLMRTGSPRNADFKGQHQLEYAWFSISDALPLLTVSAENAARQVVHACKRGQAELVISVPAKLAVTFDALFPELSSQMLAVVNQFLPEAGGVGTQRMKGRESTSSWSPSWLTTLNEEAAVRNNEVVH